MSLIRIFSEIGVKGNNLSHCFFRLFAVGLKEFLHISSNCTYSTIIGTYIYIYYSPWTNIGASIYDLSRLALKWLKWMVTGESIWVKPCQDEDSQPSCRICFGGSESGRVFPQNVCCVDERRWNFELLKAGCGSRVPRIDLSMFMWPCCKNGLTGS